MPQNRKIFNALYASMNFRLPNVTWQRKHHGDPPNFNYFFVFCRPRRFLHILHPNGQMCSKKWCYLFEPIVFQVFNLIFFPFCGSIWEYLWVPVIAPLFKERCWRLARTYFVSAALARSSGVLNSSSWFIRASCPVERKIFGSNTSWKYSYAV